MPDPIKKQSSFADQVLAEIGPVKINKNAATPVYNSTYAQGFENLPFNNDTLSKGVVADLAYTTEGYWSQLGKHAGAALVNTAGFAAATLAAIPNFIDNQFNDGNDRIVKPINELQNAALEDLRLYEPTGNEEQSVGEYLTPSWISGNTKSFWGDVIEQSGIIAGTTLGTGVLLGGARLLPGLAAAESAVGNVVKSALSNALKPATLLAENLGVSKGIANTINTQKFINGLASATKQVGVNAVQSYTEALFEGLDGERNFVESKVREYQDKYGYTPEGKELEDIKKTAEELKEARFGLNMAGLMISNTSFTKAFFGGEPTSWLSRLDKTGQTLNKTGQIVNKELSILKNAPSYLSKPLNFVAAKMPLAYSEGLEEVYQMGVEKGLDNYYSNKLETEDFEANFTNISKALKAGADGIFSKEGLKAFISGAGVGSIFQGIGNYKEKRALDKYLNDTKETTNPVTGETVKTTNRQDLTNNLNEIDAAIGEVFTTDPYENNPVSLNQTLGERVQQFVTDNNNYQDSLKTQGSYLEYDQAQRNRFDSLLPYIKKGYKDVIVSKIEGAFQDLNKESLSEEQRKNLALNKQQALEDVNTVEKFARTVDNVFFEQYGHPILDQAQRQLKNIAAFHLWNIHSLDKQKQELIDIYGDNIFQDEIAKGYTGDNINAILDKEFSKVKPLTEDVDPYKQERAILEKIKNSENPTEAYFAYKQKDRTGSFLTSEDFLVLKKQKEALEKRVQDNNSTFQNLQTLKTKPEEALRFLRDYHGKAKSIIKKTKAEEKEIEQKVDNKELIKNTVAPETLREVLEKVEPRIATPLTAQEIKELEAEVVAEKKIPVKKVVEPVKTASEQPTSETPTQKTSDKPKRLRNEKEDEASSLTSSKIFSMNTASLSIQDEIKALEAERDFHLADQDNIEQSSIDMVISEAEFKQIIIDTYEKQINELKAKANTATAQRQLLGTTEGATITSEILNDSESNLYYDTGLIRTQLHGGAKEIYTVSLKDTEGNNVPAFTVQNNKDNFLLDYKVLNEFVQEHSESLPALSELNYSQNISFVKFLEDLIINPQGLQIFEYIQKNTFTTKSDIEHDRSISQAGSKLKLFNFRYETLQSLHTKLSGENYIYKMLQQGAEFSDIAPMLKTEFLNSSALELPGYDITVKDSGAEGLIRLDGETIFRSNTISASDVQVFRGQALNNLKDGFYALFKTSRGTFFPVGVRTSQSYADLSEAGKNHFKLAMYYGKNRDDFYDVKKQENGSHTVINKSTKDSVSYKDFDTFAAWVEKERIAKNATVSFLEDTDDVLNLLVNKAKVNYKVYKNNSVKVDFILPQNVEDNIIEEAVKVEKTNLNEILDQEDFYTEFSEEIENLKEQSAEEFSKELPINIDLQITKKGETVSLKSEETLSGISYKIKSGVTKEQIQEAINNSKKRTAPLIKQEILDAFYNTGTPSYSSMSEYQLNKIKEFIEKC